MRRMMLSNQVLEVTAVGMETCFNATLHVVEGSHQLVGSYKPNFAANVVFQCRESPWLVPVHCTRFPDRVVSKGRWPPRSPDLSPPDFFLWGMLKGTVYGNKPRTLAALEDNIRREIGLVTSTTCSVALKHVCMPTAVTSST